MPLRHLAPLVLVAGLVAPSCTGDDDGPPPLATTTTTAEPGAVVTTTVPAGATAPAEETGDEAGSDGDGTGGEAGEGDGTGGE